MLTGAAVASIIIGLGTTYMSASITRQHPRHLIVDSQNETPFLKSVTTATNETGGSNMSKHNGSSWKLERPISSEMVATPSLRTEHTKQDSEKNEAIPASTMLPTSARQKREEEFQAIQEEIKRNEQIPNQSAKEKADKPNMLLLYGDDWTLKTLGVLNKAVKTPNLDKMSQNGMLFTHNCVTTSICMVSRATLYTGQYASRHKTFTQNHKAMFAPGVWNETLWPLLKANGYHTGLMGKWHHVPPPRGTFTRARFYQGEHYIKQKRDGKNEISSILPNGTKKMLCGF